MANFGEDVALAMGGALPPEAANGLPAIYQRLLKDPDPVFVVGALQVDYVKSRRRGGRPDQPVLALVCVEVPEGADEDQVRAMLRRLRDARNGGQPTLDEVSA